MSYSPIFKRSHVLQKIFERQTIEIEVTGLIYLLKTKNGNDNNVSRIPILKNVSCTRILINIGEAYTYYECFC